jgi:hypothetical protein
LDEALGLGIGLGCVKLGADVFETEPAAKAGKCTRFETGAIVGHDALDRDSKATAAFRKAIALTLFSSFVTLAESDPGGVVDPELYELPASGPGLWRGGCSDRDDR